MKVSDNNGRIFSLFLYWGVALSQSGSIKFQCIDSYTGYSVKCECLAYHTSKNLRKKILSNSDGFIYFVGDTGKWTFEFNAHEKKKLTTYFVIGVGDNLQVEVHLDPIYRIEKEPITKGENEAVIKGFITDKISGRPIKNAFVVLDFLGATWKTRTNKDGHFLLRVESINGVYDPLEKPNLGLLKVYKKGYKDLIKEFILVPDIIHFILRLDKGAGIIKLEERHGLYENIDKKEDTLHNFNIKNSKSNNISLLQSNCWLDPPSSIRVGLSCSCTSCSNVAVMSLESYVQKGLDEEWIASWHANSLRSGAVAYRSYGAWYVINPISANYDICSTTCCQVYDGSDMYAGPQSAAIYTSGIMLNNNGGIAKAFYSAENNKGGGDCNTSYFNCNDGEAGRPSWGFPCISDPVCAGTVGCGHGAGMCQWGSQRWANNQGKVWKWIVDHYYNSVGWSVSSPLKISSASASPTSVCKGSSFNIYVNIDNMTSDNHPNIMIGASLYNGNWYSDPPNDIKINAVPGLATYPRTFNVSSNQPSGYYDLIIAIWFDIDGNNQINSGDWMMCSYSLPNYIYVPDNPQSLQISLDQCNYTATFSWTNTGNNWYLDISDDPNFTYFYNKNVSNLTSTTAPGGFNCGTGNCPNPSLTFQPGVTYYWRIWNGACHTYGSTFSFAPLPQNLQISLDQCNYTATFSWTNTGNNWYLDISDDPNFTYFYNKNVSNLTSTTAPGGFNCWTGNCPNPSLTFQPGVTYYWRIWNGACHTYDSTFSFAPLPNANFTFVPDTGCVGDTVYFSDASQGNIISWTWNFGDGASSNAQNPYHIYYGKGSYTVYLTIATNAGCSSSTYKNIFIEDYPIASFTYNIVNNSAYFTDNSQNAYSWYWEFGDGASSNQTNPYHIYSSSGTYIVKLIVTNICGSSTFEDTLNIVNTGIQEAYQEDLKVMLSNEEIVIINTNEFHDIIKVYLFDITGKIAEISENYCYNNTMCKIPLRNLSQGMYYLMVYFKGNALKIPILKLPFGNY